MDSVLRGSAKDLTGQKFGRLTALHPTDRRDGKNIVWRCVCECGQTHDVAGAGLTTGHTKSCGCLRRSLDAVRLLKHGAAKPGQNTLTYKSWSAMRSRCNAPSNKCYHLYGGRGIRVCERWNDFEAFLSDLGARPSSRHTLERMDSNGHYEPGNVEWATPRQQSRNTSRTQMVTIGGRTQCLTDWITELGISRTAVYLRIRKGWSIERSLATPSQKSRAAHAVTPTS